MIEAIHNWSQKNKAVSQRRWKDPLRLNKSRDLITTS